MFCVVERKGVAELPSSSGVLSCDPERAACPVCLPVKMLTTVGVGVVMCTSRSCPQGCPESSLDLECRAEEALRAQQILT